MKHTPYPFNQAILEVNPRLLSMSINIDFDSEGAPIMFMNSFRLLHPPPVDIWPIKASEFVW